MRNADGPTSDNRSPTMQDVAQLAGVSASTVSLVVSGRKNGKSRISDETAVRVRQAVKDLNYVPSQHARQLRTQATRRICLSVPRLSVPTYDEVAEQVQDAAAAEGYHMIVNLSRNTEESILQQMQGGLADGLVLILEHSPRESLAESLQTLAQSGVAIVVFDNSIAPRTFDVVRNTDLEACYGGVRYLAESGRKRIACLALEDSKGEPHERLTSYYRALEDAGLPTDPSLVSAGAETRQSAYLKTKSLLTLDEPPDAIFACTDVAALSALRAVQDSGLQVPDDVAILGAGNIIEGELSRPSLSTIGPDEHDYSGVFDFLLSRLNASEPLPGRELVTPWSLNLRDSA